MCFFLPTGSCGGEKLSQSEGSARAIFPLTCATPWLDPATIAYPSAVAFVRGLRLASLVT